jgi:adenine-specific DNA-methyltransferase
MDFVVGNPPYVRVHNLGNYYELVKKFSFSQAGMTDLFIVFFEVGLNMLNNNGKMCYISPTSY